MKRFTPEPRQGEHGNRGNQHKKPKIRQNGDLPDRFTKDVADKTGISERTVQRAVERRKINEHGCQKKREADRRFRPYYQ